MTPQTVVRLQSVTMRFGSSIALSNVTVSFQAGRVHALVGENGAGKSTLVNLITHRLRPAEGEVEIVGAGPIDSPRAAIDAGVAAVYQDRKLAPNLTGLENIFLGREPVVGAGLMNRSEMRRAAEELLTTTVGFRARILTLPVRRLSVPEQEAVAIAKALLAKPKILIFDEPSESLSPRERELLFELIRRLRDQGLAILYITHALSELSQVADEVTVLRDGRVAGAGLISELDKRQIVHLMIGEELASEGHPARRAAEARGEPLLAADGLASVDGRIQDISLTLYPHEVVGVSGLEGSGRSELVRALTGLVPLERGVITLGKRRFARLTPRAAWKQGVAFVPRDRHREGILPGLSVSAQISFASLDRFSKWGVVRRHDEASEAQEIGTRLRLRTAGYTAPIESLSGGNQQKTVIGRALCADARIWLLEDPTAAIDVRSRADVLELVRSFADDGGCAVLASSDVAELAAVCDRVLVLVDGRIADEVAGERLNEAELIRRQYGVDRESVAPKKEEEPVR